MCVGLRENALFAHEEYVEVIYCSLNMSCSLFKH